MAPCPWLAAGAAVVMLLRLAASVGTFNHTYDEPYHIASGVALWQTGHLALGLEHPPLPRLVAGLPLYLSGLRVDPRYLTPTYRGEGATFDAGADLLFAGPLPYQSVLARARLAMLVFPAAALLYVYLLGRWLAGPRAGLLACVFFSFDPTLLGHAFWVTTDAAAAAGFLAATYHGLRFITAPTWPRTVWAALAIAAALACKLSCGLVIPGLALLLVLRRPAVWFRRPRYTTRWRLYRRGWPSAGQLLAAAGLGFLFLWAFYLFDVGRLADQDLLTVQRRWLALPQAIKEALVPMPSLFLGLFCLIAHNGAGHGAYLLGEWSRSGWWYYFPVALMVKSPVALCMAMVLAFAAAVHHAARRRTSATPAPAARTGRLAPTLALLVCPALFLAVCLRAHINIGIRHVLPVIPFLYLFVAIHLRRGWQATALVALAAVAMIETAAVHPDYVAFFNAAAGGSGRGDRYLADSNLDWGQDVARFAQWSRHHAPPGRPITCRLAVSSPERLLAQYGLDPDMLTAPPRGLFAISRTEKVGLATFRPGPDYAWLRRYPLIQRIGQSIEVYDLGPDPLPEEVARTLVGRPATRPAGESALGALPALDSP